MKLSDEKFTQVILDSLGEGLFTVDQYFRINSFNKAAEKIMGISREQVIGDFCKNIFKTNRCFGDCPIGKVLETGEFVSDLESEFEDSNEGKIPVRLNASVLKNEQGNPIGGVVSFRDMSYLEKIHNDLHIASQFHGIVGRHKSMLEIFNLIEEISDSESSVLITGESGTGKEMIADAIQKSSRVSKGPYIKVNCSVFPPNLLASELFGHVKGSFTDAYKDRIGRFEMADKGTIFLDEIAEMSLQMQVQILRVLQEGTFERIGESKTRRVKVRVIAATNKDLRKEMKEGRFREDLYYRLNVIPIHIPPLRERRCDIAHLAQHFINKYSLISMKNIKEADDDAIDILLSYDWPGNVRELENTIEYAFARTKDTVIHASKLPPTVRLNRECSERVSHKMKAAKEDDEFERLKVLLESYQWNRSKVAKKLGIGRTTLWRKMKKLGLES
jgi:PAS domain S-box-containing protein